MLHKTCIRLFHTIMVLLALVMGEAQAQESCSPAIGVVSSSEGRVELHRRDGGRWQAASAGTVLCEGDSVRAAEFSRAALQLINDAVLRVDQNSTLQLVSVTAKEEERSIFNLISGAVQSFSRKPKKLAINTPYINGLIEGTEFAARAGADEGEITVIEGTVIAENTFGSVSVPAGQQATAPAGRAPQARIVANPRDAVQWSLYYPPVLLAPGDGASPALRDAEAKAAAADTAAALAALDRMPAGERGAEFHVHRAALLLNVGQVAPARQAIDAALAVDPTSGPALALRAVIAAVQNDRQAALADGREAVRRAPDRAATHIALSYAEQASFDIEAARQTLEQAVASEPDNALAWARLAEVRLMLGERTGARAAAERASEIAPNLSRTQLVEGFSALALFRNNDAEAAFKRAINLSPADPLGHFGLGLTKISRGNLDAGRKDLEVAVALDSGNSLMRSYLGKAYFEERRSPLDEEQYAIAKQLDPRDPTPYLYAGISKQADNRSVAALREIERSIELNDNRAVFRSRQLLDEDRAVRQADLGQIYTNLGFRELGYREADKSLAIDPANASAHRLLSNLYVGETRREISRVSELFQAQMLQDVNLVPVQPSLAETNIQLRAGLGGPASPGFNEFTPLFEQNQVQFNGQAFAGNNATYGGESVVSGIYDQVSVSAGGFGYWTDGVRPNSDIREKVGNFFIQGAVLPTLNLQMEARSQNVENGDLAFNFDKNDFEHGYDRRLEQDSIRFGARYSPDHRSDFLVSYIYNQRDERVQLDSAADFFGIGIDFPFFSKVKADDKGSQGEAQYVYKGESFNILAGGAYGDVDRRFDNRLRLFDDTNSLALTDDENVTITDPRGYLYGNIEFPQNVTWTIGGALQQYENDAGNDITVNGFLPKLGVRWDLTKTFVLRAAAFEAIKPVITNNRTLEPTQVAGFNQYFDDENGTKFWRFGGGADWKISPDVSAGAEVTWRYIDEPLYFNTNRTWQTEQRREQNHRLYAYWTPTDTVALSAGFVYDRFRADGQDFATDSGVVPERVITYSVPVGVKYFSPLGFFAGVGGTFVHQDVRRASTAEFPTAAEGNDSFFLVDAAIGYALPKRFGLISFEVRNLFDSSFKYQDDSYREFRDDPAVSRFFPERTFIGRLVINY